MAVTINTIPAQSGELVRMLVTVGVGGPNTSNRNWWRESDGVGSVSDDSDVELAADLIINRIQWHRLDQLRFFKAGAGSFIAAVAAGGVLDGKALFIAVDDTDPGTDVKVDLVAANVSAIINRLGVRMDSAEQTLLGGVVTGGLVNIVFADATAVADVFVDTAASLTAGAPTITASADKEIPAAIFDTAAVLTAAPPTLTASAEKVGLAQEFHDTAAVLTAGVPVVSALAELVEGGIREIAAEIVAGPPSVFVSAEKVGLTQPFHDTAAALTAGAPALAVSAEMVGIAQEFHDSAAVIEAGPPSLVVTAEVAEGEIFDVVTSLVAGVPQVEVEAVAVALADAFTDTAVSLTAGAPSFTVGVVKRTPSQRTGPLANSLTSGIATIKSTLLAGGLLRAVEWHQPTGPRDVRGRQAVSVSLLDVLIEERPGLARSTIDTDRTDNTVLTILDPVAITDEHLFRWGDQTYKVSKIDGVVKSEATGVRFSSEVTVIR